MRPRTVDVKSGLWTDYDLPRWRSALDSITTFTEPELIDSTDKQLLVHEETAQLISNTIAIATTLVLPRLLVLLQLSLPLILQPIRRLTLSIRGRCKQEPGRLTSHMLETFQTSESIGTAASRLTQEHLGMRHIELEGDDRSLQTRCREFYFNFQQEMWSFSIICIAVLALGVFYLTIQVTAILTAGIISSNFGIPTSPTCGYWIPPRITWNTNPSVQNPPFVMDMDEFHESIYYADTHYDSAATSRAESKYVSQKIDYREHHDASCPFDRNYCISDRSTFIMDTGLQNSRVLGINTAERYLFRKQAICTPLKTQHLNRTFLDQPEGTVVANENDNGIDPYYDARPGDPYHTMPILKKADRKDYSYLFRYVLI